MANQIPGPSIRTVFEWAAILAVLALFFGGTQLQSFFQTTNHDREDAPVSQDKIESLVYPDKNLQCPSHDYGDIHIFSRSPLIIYIPNFISDEESQHLIDLR